MEIKKVKESYVVGGVIDNCVPEFLIEDMFNGVNLTYENWIQENDIDEEDFEVLDSYYGDNDTYLIGYKKDSAGLYDIDFNAEYSAIISEIYTQVTYSKYISYTMPCSPCFLGQNDLATKGDYPTFTLPPEIFGDGDHLEIYELVE